MKNIITKFDLQRLLIGLLMTLVLILICDRYDLFEGIGRNVLKIMIGQIM